MKIVKCSFAVAPLVASAFLISCAPTKNEKIWMPAVDVSSFLTFDVKIEGDRMEVLDDAISENEVSSVQPYAKGEDVELLQYCSFGIKKGIYKLNFKGDGVTISALEAGETNANALEIKSTGEDLRGLEFMQASTLFPNSRLTKGIFSVSWKGADSLESYKDSKTAKETFSPDAKTIHIF